MAAPDADNIIARYIAPNPQRPGAAEAVLVGYDIPVWAIIGYLRAVDGDLVQTAHDYRIPVEAFRAAIASYERHRDAIDSRLAANCMLVA